MGYDIDSSIPPCAWVPRSAMQGSYTIPDGTLTIKISEPFRWVEATIAFEKK